MKISKERRRSIESHIKHGDYFGTLATVLDLMRQEIERGGYKKSHAKLLVRLSDDLMHLQQLYKIGER